MRPSFPEVFLRMAWLLSERSTCSRLHVGAVITTMDCRHVVGVGYNNNASGLPDQCDSATPGACGCLHAEENAAINCTTTAPKLVFTTHLPCVMCAKRLINLGSVRRVYYSEDYRIREGLQVLEAAAIPHEHFPITRS